MAANYQRHNTRRYVYLPPLLGLVLLLQSPPFASSFGQGAQIQANFRLYCNRRGGQRFPVHFDTSRCGGLCRPKNDLGNLFDIHVNATTYFGNNVEVLIRANPRGGVGNNIRGFAVVAMTEDERIVGSFSGDPNEILVASCDPLMEGDTVFHARASLNRRSLRLVWEPASKNYGKVRFRAWVVVQHNDIYVMDSEFLLNEVSGTSQFDMEDNFYTFILQVFNISRSAATILPASQTQQPSTQPGKGDAQILSRLASSEVGTTPYPHPTDIQGNIALRRQQSSDTRAVQGLAAPDLRIGTSGNDATRMIAPSRVTDREIARRGNGLASGFFADVIGRFTTLAPPGGNVSRFAGTTRGGSLAASAAIAGGGAGFGISSSRRNSGISGSTSRRSEIDRSSSDSGSTILDRFSSISSSINSITTNSRRSSISSNSGSSNESGTGTRDNGMSNNNSSSRGGVGSSDVNTKSNNVNSSTILVTVSMANGQSMELRLPSLTSFEQAFQRRLMTTGYDVSSDDPFHQLKRQVPTFTEVFPRPLPPTTTALDSLPPLSSGNPFFQGFGTSSSSSSSSFSSSSSSSSSRSPFSPSFSSTFSTPTSRFASPSSITQTFGNLLSSTQSQSGFGAQAQRARGFGQMGMGQRGQSSFAGRPQSTTGRFPASSDLMQRARPSQGTGSGFGNTNRGLLPSSSNALRPFAGSFGGGLTQQMSSRNSASSFPGGTNTAAARNAGGGLFSVLQRLSTAAGFSGASSNPAFGNLRFPPAGSIRSLFPGTGSLFGGNSQFLRSGTNTFPSSQTNPFSQGFGQLGATGFAGMTNNGISRQRPQFSSPQQQGLFTGRQTGGMNSNLFSGLGAGNGLFGQQRNSAWNGALSQQFSSATGFGNRFATGQQSGGTNLFNSLIRNSGFPSQSGFQFSGNFPASPSSFLGRQQNGFSSFPNALQTVNTRRPTFGINPFASNVAPGRTFNPSLANLWTGAGARGQNSGFLASSSFPRGVSASRFATG